ncbi:MAG: HDOD domain-containing protein [Deltaproteobacteria bacterium]|nr:HDOD domain-containing protein [Deltaproteobacteria bacterium]
MRVEEILGKVHGLPPFPAVIHRVTALLSDPLVSADSLLEVVKYDQSITANVIRMCNSALLAGAQRVSSLKDALIRIGNRNLIHVILSAGGNDLLRKEVPGYDLGRGELWKHSILCALLAESLCDVVEYGRKDKAFTAGLMHDIGKVVLSEFVGRQYREIRDAAQARKTSFAEGEVSILGVSHAEIGGRIGEAWNFDPELVNAIRHHHAPAEGEADPLLFLVHLSDVLCMTGGAGFGADGLQYNVDYELLKRHAVGPKEFELGLIRLVEVAQHFHGIVAMYD